MKGEENDEKKRKEKFNLQSNWARNVEYNSSTKPHILYIYMWNEASSKSIEWKYYSSIEPQL